MEYGLGEYGNGTGAYSKDSTQPSETSIVNATIKAIRDKFPDSVVVKIHGGGFQKAGVPDLYIAVNGVGLWVEMKRSGSDTTALQKRFLEKLATNGVFSGTAESADRVLAMLDTCLGIKTLDKKSRA